MGREIEAAILAKLVKEAFLMRTDLNEVRE